MSIYSPYIVYPPEADELFVCPQDDCENCTFDCDIKRDSNRRGGIKYDQNCKSIC